MPNPAPSIEDLTKEQRSILRFRILAVKGVGDQWVDDHIACRQIEIETEAGTVITSLWWCGDVAVLVDVADQSPRAMAAVLHYIYDQFPPDVEVPTERLPRALAALMPYLEGDAANKTEAAADLLTDLMHFADQYNVDLYKCWQVAGRHHQAEQG